LLCDVDRAVSIKYGAAADVNTTYPARISYVIDPAGLVMHAFEHVDPGAHADDVLKVLDGG
jgi:peroxiredoxin